MANFCGKCGSRLDSDTGACPNPSCEEYKAPENNVPEKPKFYWRFIILPVMTLLMLVGLIWELNYFGIIDISSIICLHEWQPATCIEETFCLKCGKIDGQPLGHVSDTAHEEIDIINGEARSAVVCSRCSEVISTTSEKLDSFVKDNCYIFSVHEFLERLKCKVQLSYKNVSYECSSSEFGLMVEFYYGGGNKAILTFLHPDMSAVMGDEIYEKNVYCVSMAFLSYEDDSEEPFCFDQLFMSCDPKITEDEAVGLKALAMATLANAIEDGDMYGTFQNNELSYDVMYTLGESAGFPGSKIHFYSIYPSGAIS